MTKLSNEDLLVEFIEGANTPLRSPDLELRIDGAKLSVLRGRSIVGTSVGNKILAEYILLSKYEIDKLLLAAGYLTNGLASANGFTEYRKYALEGLTLNWTKASELWTYWWKGLSRETKWTMVLHEERWYHIAEGNVQSGGFSLQLRAEDGIIIKVDYQKKDYTIWGKVAAVPVESLPIPIEDRFEDVNTAIDSEGTIQQVSADLAKKSAIDSKLTGRTSGGRSGMSLAQTDQDSSLVAVVSRDAILILEERVIDLQNSLTKMKRLFDRQSQLVLGLNNSAIADEKRFVDLEDKYENLEAYLETLNRIIRGLAADATEKSQPDTILLRAIEAQDAQDNDTEFLY